MQQVTLPDHLKVVVPAKLDIRQDSDGCAQYRVRGLEYLSNE